MTLTLEIPDEALATMALPPEDAEREIRLELALTLYAREVLSMGQAAVLANVTRADFERALAARQIERPYDAAELERDLAWARRPL